MFLLTPSQPKNMPFNLKTVGQLSNDDLLLAMLIFLFAKVRYDAN